MRRASFALRGEDAALPRPAVHAGPDAGGDGGARQSEAGALSRLRVVLHEEIGDADAFDADVESVIDDQLGDRRAEAAGQRVLLQGDQPAMRARELDDELLVERLDEARVDDGREEPILRQGDRTRQAPRRPSCRAR